MIDFHRKMLADEVRNAAFTEALRRAVKLGESVVADIGAGTGYLGFVASKLGARECHLYEVGDVWSVGKRIAEKNGITNCRFIQRHSTLVKNPVQADIVVSETLGNYALEERILETMDDARQRFLKPGGTLIPAKLTQSCCPIVSDRLVREIDTWGAVGMGLDFSPARAVAFHNAYVRTVRAADLMQSEDAVQQLDAVDFSEPNNNRRELSAQWKLAADVTVHGVAVWWEAELAPGITLSTSPYGKPTHWEQIALFIPKPLAAKAGDALLFHFTSDTTLKAGMNLTWQCTLFRGGKKKDTSPLMDMRKGFLS